MTSEISADQRKALYWQLRSQLNGFDALPDPASSDGIKGAYRVGRRMLDALRLLQKELGWEPASSRCDELRTLPGRA